MSTTAGAFHKVPHFDESDSDYWNAVLADNWWVAALRGVLAIAFGLVAIAFPGLTLIGMVLFFAAYKFVDGILDLILAVRAMFRRQPWAMLLLEGVLDLAVAAIAFLLPGITVLAFVLLVAVWAAISGGVALYNAVRLKTSYGRWWLVLGGLASIILAVMLVAAPAVGAVVLTWWFGAWALVLGVALIVLAYQLRAKHIEAEKNPVPRPAE